MVLYKMENHGVMGGMCQCLTWKVVSIGEDKRIEETNLKLPVPQR